MRTALLACLVLAFLWLPGQAQEDVPATTLSATPQASELRGEREEGTLDRAGEVNPGYAPQIPVHLHRDYTPVFNEALWLKAGGFLQLEAMGDFGEIGNPIVLAPSQLGTSSAADIDSGFIPLGADARISFRRTRLFLDLYSPYPRIRDGARVYGEVDFNGKNGAVNIRHLYLALPYLIVGRTNSAFKDPTAEPETIDSQGPNAKMGLRQQGARLIVPVGQNDKLCLAWEDPGPGLSPQGTDLTDDGLKRRPDLVGHFRHSADWGHLQLSAVRRDLTLADSAQPAVPVAPLTGWGLGLGGQVHTEGKDNFSFGLSGGPGLGRYINDLAGTGSELGVTRSGQVETQFAWGGYLAYQHWLNEQTRFNTYVSAVGVNLLDGQPPGSFAQGYKVSANVMHDLSKNLRIGAEYEHGLRVSKDGATVNGGRLEFMLRYGF